MSCNFFVFMTIFGKRRSDRISCSMAVFGVTELIGNARVNSLIGEFSGNVGSLFSSVDGISLGFGNTCMVLGKHDYPSKPIKYHVFIHRKRRHVQITCATCADPVSAVLFDSLRRTKHRNIFECHRYVNHLIDCSSIGVDRYSVRQHPRKPMSVLIESTLMSGSNLLNCRNCRVILTKKLIKYMMGMPFSRRSCTNTAVLLNVYVLSKLMTFCFTTAHTDWNNTIRIKSIALL